MNFIVKVEGIQHQSQVITISRKRVILIDNLADFVENSEHFYNYEGREVFATYMGKSRIDGFPMFKIDTLQLDREDKISQILK